MFDEAEQITLDEIQDALELDKAKFEAEMNAAIEKVDQMDEDAATEYLQEAAAAVADDEIGIVFEATLQLVLADGVLSRCEVDTLLVIADALGIDDVDAILLLADMAHSEEELTVELGE